MAFWKPFGGFILWFVRPSALNHIARLFLQHDLPFDRNEFLHNSSVSGYAASRDRQALYFRVPDFHGLIKAVLVAGALVRRALGLSADDGSVQSFQRLSGLFRFTHTHSLALIFITVFDVLIIYLTWREYAGPKNCPHSIHTPRQALAAHFTNSGCLPFRPRIVIQAETHPIRNRRVIVEQKNIHGIRLGIGQRRLPFHLKRIGRRLRRIRQNSVRHFQPVHVRLMLDVPADRHSKSDRREN